MFPQGISTGRYHGAILTNNDAMETSCSVAGRSCGDLVFPLPFCPELHFSEFNSSVADMKNSVSVSPCQYNNSGVDFFISGSIKCTVFLCRSVHWSPFGV